MRMIRKNLGEYDGINIGGNSTPVCTEEYARVGSGAASIAWVAIYRTTCTAGNTATCSTSRPAICPSTAILRWWWDDKPPSRPFDVADDSASTTTTALPVSGFYFPWLEASLQWFPVVLSGRTGRLFSNGC